MAANKFSDRLHALRKTHLHLTLKAFAERVGTSQGYVHEMEAGRKRNPSEELVGKICAAFAVRREWLLDGEGEIFSGAKEESPAYGRPASKAGHDYQARYFALLEAMSAVDLIAMVSSILRDETKTLDARLQEANEINPIIKRKEAELASQLAELRRAEDAPAKVKEKEVAL